jgi:hypothetical protein
VGQVQDGEIRQVWGDGRQRAGRGNQAIVHQGLRVGLREREREIVGEREREREIVGERERERDRRREREREREIVGERERERERDGRGRGREREREIVGERERDGRGRCRWSGYQVIRLLCRGSG